MKQGIAIPFAILLFVKSMVALAQDDAVRPGASPKTTLPAAEAPATPRGIQAPTRAEEAAAKPATPAEQLELQERKFQSLESFSKVLSLLETLYVDKSAADADALVEKAIRGMVAGFDPHTTYLSQSQLRELTSDTSGRFGGVGVVISSSGGFRLEILETVPDSPAAKADLRPGDVIVGIEGVRVSKTNIEELLGKLRGPPGSTVKLEVAPAAEFKAARNNPKPKTKVVRLVREIIRSASVTHHELADGYPYVKVSVFQEDTGEQLDKILREYEARSKNGRLEGLVLDLRNNPGGLLDQAVRVADQFLDSGVIVSTIGRDHAKQEVEFASKRNTHPYMPLVVLVNEGSASASEIVAGALQDHNRALIVGAQTFGKGSVQTIVPLPNGAGLKMTIARYYTPSGRSIQAKGVTPDILIAPLDAKPAKDVAAQARKPQRLLDEDGNDRDGMRREADLEGHLESADLGTGLPATGFAKDLEKWPLHIRNDHQLKVAYTYIRSWQRFDRFKGPGKGLGQQARVQPPLPARNSAALGSAARDSSRPSDVAGEPGHAQGSLSPADAAGHVAPGAGQQNAQDAHL